MAGIVVVAVFITLVLGAAVLAAEPGGENLRRTARATFFLAAACVAVTCIGFLIAAQWYADDACPSDREEWQCDVGTWALGLAFWGVPITALFVALSAVLMVLYAVRQSR